MASRGPGMRAGPPQWEVVETFLARVAKSEIEAAGVDLPTIAIGAVGAFLLLRYKVNSTRLIIGSALAGSLVHTAGLHGGG